MKLTEIKLRDATGNRVKFTRDELLDLALFIHDKRHVLNRYSSKNAALEKALKNFSEKSPILWRGVYPEEEKMLIVGKVFSPVGYMSMTEHEKQARGFAHATKKMMRANEVEAFPYWKFNIEHLQLPLKKTDPEAFANNDGQYAIDSLREEAEWIVGHDTKLEVVAERSDGDFTIYEVKQV